MGAVVEYRASIPEVPSSSVLLFFSQTDFVTPTQSEDGSDLSIT